MDLENIHLSYGPLSLSLHPLGARMTRLQFHDRDMILPTPAAFDPQSDWGYVGAIMGPVANRLSCAPDLPGWQGPDSGVILHGEQDGLHRHIWQVEEVTPRAARFVATLPSGHGGFVANRRIEAHYTLTHHNRVRLSLRATTDAPTLMNLTSHPYWTLGSTKGIAGQRLWVDAAHMLVNDETELPTGALLDLSGTEYDHRIPRALLPGDPPLDNNYCLAPQRRFTPAPVCSLEALDGWAMEMWTTEPGLQVYDGRTLDAIGQAPYAGLALEPQYWPDAPAHARFPSILFAPGMTCHAVSEFRFFVGSGRMREGGAPGRFG